MNQRASIKGLYGAFLALAIVCLLMVMVLEPHPVPSEGETHAIAILFFLLASPLFLCGAMLTRHLLSQQTALYDGLFDIVKTEGSDLPASIFLGRKLPDLLSLVSQQIRTAEQLNALLEHTLSVVPDSVMIVRTCGTISHANPAARKLIAERGAARSGENIFEALPEVGAAVKRAFAIGESRTEECRELASNDKHVHLRLHLYPVTIQTEGETSLIVIAHDSTGYQETLSELTMARDAAEIANKTKGLFLAKMSHEIRTPMSGILGMTDILLTGQLDRDQRRYLEMVKYSANSLFAIVNDLLDLSKIEAGKLEIHVHPFDLRESIHTLSQILQMRAQQRGLEFVIQIDDDVPTGVVGDAHRLAQVISNLLQNAIKFTFNGGGVVLLVSLVGRSGSHAEIQFAVIDSGIGIPRHKFNAIFEPFTQADSSTTRKFGGTGLGLSIVADLVRLMGGALAVQSREGVGSVFSFRLNMQLHDDQTVGADQPAQLPAIRRGVPESGDKPHILLVEDNSLNQLLACRLLENEGYRVSVAGNGKIALQKLEAASFDLILMDCQMPEMDGFEATRRIREGERGSDRHLPIVAVTAHAMSGDRERCLEAGMDDYLSKPIRKDRLMDTIEKNLGRSGAEA